MSITASDIVIYASENMPHDDGSTAGGDINSGIRVVFEDIQATSIVRAVSDNASDTQTITITGRDSAGVIVTDNFSLNGTTAVSGSQQFERILGVSIDAVANGSITIGDDPYTTGIGTIYQNESGFVRPFYDATAEPVGGSDKVLYEKVFVKNNNTSNALLGTTVEEVSSGLYSITDFGLERIQEGTEYINNRLTAPTGSGPYGNGPSGIPGSDLNPLAYEGIWLRLTLNAGTAAQNSYYQLLVKGATT